MQWVDGLSLFFFHEKNGPETGHLRGGEKRGLHFNDKFSRSDKEVKNGGLGYYRETK